MNDHLPDALEGARWHSERLYGWQRSRGRAASHSSRNQVARRPLPDFWESFRARARACARLTIHHKFWCNHVELRQKACRDGGLVAAVTRHDAGMPKALLTHGATRAGTAATHGQETADASSAVAPGSC